MALSRYAAKLVPDQGSDDQLSQIYGNQYDAESNPDGFVNLGVAENVMMHRELLQHIDAKLKIPPLALTYGDGQKRLRKAAARFLTRHLHPAVPIAPEHVAISNGCTTAIENLARALADPGDAVLIGRPFYGAFPADVGKRTGIELVPISFGDCDGIAPAGVDAHEKAIHAAQARGQRVAAIILSHPHNPLGRYYSRDALTAYMKLCQRHQIHLISDETYALSVYENRVDEQVAPEPFRSVLSLDPTGIIDGKLVHTVWGMSKDFGANGLRIGFTISQHHARLRAALHASFEYSWTSSLSDLVTADILEDDDWVEGYVRDNQRRLSQQHEKVLRWARSLGMDYAAGANAGFFVWVDLGSVYARHHGRAGNEGRVSDGRADGDGGGKPSSGDIDKTVMASLLAHRVFLADGVRFGSEKPGWFRIVFSREDAYLDTGLRRITAALGVPGGT